MGIARSAPASSAAHRFALRAQSLERLRQILLALEQDADERDVLVERRLVETVGEEGGPPVVQLVGGGALAESVDGAQLVEGVERSVEQRAGQSIEVDSDDPPHQLRVGELDVMQHAPA